MRAPLSFQRTLQMPRRPGLSRQRWPHATQRSAPPSRIASEPSTAAASSVSWSVAPGGTAWSRSNRAMTRGSPVTMTECWPDACRRASRPARMAR